MAEYSFERECRTPHSESYSVESDSGDDVARVDLHFTASGAYATLCVNESLTEDDIQDLIGQIDERLVVTRDPYREDFVVSVWTGLESGLHSDEDDEDEDEDGDEEEKP